MTYSICIVYDYMCLYTYIQYLYMYIQYFYSVCDCTCIVYDYMYILYIHVCTCTLYIQYLCMYKCTYSICIVYDCLYVYIRVLIASHVTLTVHLVSSTFVSDNLSNTFEVEYMYLYIYCFKRSKNNPYNCGTSVFCPGYLEWWLDFALHLVLFIQYILDSVSVAVLSER